MGNQLVGFSTLVFQAEIANLIHPGRNATFEEEKMYQFWVYHDPLPWNTRKEYILALMVAGWIFLAGTLHALINFDPRVCAQAKLYAFWSFFVCDWFWMVLMYNAPDIIHISHIQGSAFVVVIRLIFAIILCV